MKARECFARQKERRSENGSRQRGAKHSEKHLKRAEGRRVGIEATPTQPNVEKVLDRETEGFAEAKTEGAGMAPEPEAIGR